jgi:hypothetical protein
MTWANRAPGSSVLPIGNNPIQVREKKGGVMIERSKFPAGISSAVGASGEIESVIRQAAQRVLPELGEDAVIVPEDAVDARDLDHPGRYLPHTVVLDRRLLQKLCRPGRVEHGSPGLRSF